MPIISVFLFNIVIKACHFGGESPGISAADQNWFSTFFPLVLYLLFFLLFIVSSLN